MVGIKAYCRCKRATKRSSILWRKREIICRMERPSYKESRHHHLSMILLQSSLLIIVREFFIITLFTASGNATPALIPPAPKGLTAAPVSCCAFLRIKQNQLWPFFKTDRRHNRRLNDPAISGPATLPVPGSLFCCPQPPLFS